MYGKDRMDGVFIESHKIELVALSTGYLEKYYADVMDGKYGFFQARSSYLIPF
jgi:hypothetical protein